MQGILIRVDDRCYFLPASRGSGLVRTVPFGRFGTAVGISTRFLACWEYQHAFQCCQVLFDAQGYSFKFASTVVKYTVTSPITVSYVYSEAICLNEFCRARVSSLSMGME